MRDTGCFYSQEKPMGKSIFMNDPVETLIDILRTVIMCENISSC